VELLSCVAGFSPLFLNYLKRSLSGCWWNYGVGSFSDFVFEFLF